MAGYGFGGSSGYGSFSGAPAVKHGGGGAFGFVKNLGNDIKGAVEGFPAGVVHLAEHPVGSLEQMGRATWSTWSPLFHGQFTKFGQGVYQHPLAPILDIASVLSLGIGTAARVGAGMDALAATSAEADAGLMAGKGAQVARAVTSPRYFAPGGQLAKDAKILSENATIGAAKQELAPASNIFHSAARLRLPSAKILEDPQMQGRMPIVKQMSENPARHAMQNVLGKGFDHLPPGMKGYFGRKVYERALYGYMARRSVLAGAAKTGLITASDRLAHMEADAGKIPGRFPTLDHAVMAHRLLEDPNVGFSHRLQLAAHGFQNLADNAPVKAASVEQAAQFLAEHRHMGVVKKFPDPGEAMLGAVRSRISHYQGLVAKYAGVRPIDKIQAEIDHHNAVLKDMHDKGYLHTQTPALNSKGEPALNPTAKQSMEQHAQPILEHQRILKRLNVEMKAASKAHPILDKAHTRLGELHGQRMDLEQRSLNHGLTKYAQSHESLVSYANNLGRIATRSFKNKKWTEERIANYIRSNGWVGADGTVPIVPMHDAKMLGNEMAGGLTFLRSLRKATGWWKTLQVKLSPKTIVNNSLANHVIATFRHSDPITAFRALYHAWRIAHGKDFADQLIHDAVLKGGDKGWLMRHFGPELHNDFLHGTEEDLSPEARKMGEKAARKSDSRLGRTIRGPMMYGPVSKIADRPVRLGAIATYVRREPSVIHMADSLQRTAKLEGRDLSRNMALDQAASRVLKEDPTLRERAANFGRTIAGDYLAQTPKERLIKDFVPFYLWDRHIAKSAANIVLDTPIRAAFAQQLSHQGLSQTQKYLGALPEFLQSAIPMSMLGFAGSSKDGRMNAVVGPSLNPFGTLGEFAGAAQSLVAGGDLSGASDVLGQINPLLTDSISAATGKNIVTGTALKGPGGILPNVLYNIGSGFPQEKIVQSAIQGPVTQTTTASGKTFPKLYSQNELAAISNFLGIPIKQISPSTAQYEAKAQQPKRKHNPFGGY